MKFLFCNIRLLLFTTLTTLALACTPPETNSVAITGQGGPFLWKNATIYFLLTDRFCNGMPHNDVTLERTEKAAPLRGFMGGDLQGITQKINEEYFSDLGVTALWLTPVVEQIQGFVSAEYGANYGFHGYWTRDWTALDPNFGTETDLREMVRAAHAKGIRIVLDVVLNHTGPVTSADPLWPPDWVRTSPLCSYHNYESTVSCTLSHLPDILTESEKAVELPQFLIEKWKAEGRYEKEMKELDEFFQKTGYPRAPKYYLIKWLADFVREFGVDGFRVDTAKHLEEAVWGALYKQAAAAFAGWKQAHPEEVPDNTDFYMVGEVYGYAAGGGRQYDFGDKKVDYYNEGFHSLINFGFKYDAANTYEALFSKYSHLLQTDLQGQGTLNFLSSHDDGAPFDPAREKTLEAGTKLLLSPGTSQIYYGEETGRTLQAPGASGDAVLRSFMNWEDIKANRQVNGQHIQDILRHWQKLGVFRREHVSVGAGRHQKISDTPYVFSRSYQSPQYTDKVVVALDLSPGTYTIGVRGVFDNGETVRDYYSGREWTVANNTIVLETEYNMVLLGRPKSSE